MAKKTKKAKKIKDGFKVTVDNRNVWVVLRKRGGDCWHATFWWQNKMYWRATDCANYETAKTASRDKVAEVLGAVTLDTLTLRKAIDDCVAARWPTPESYNQHRKVTLLNLNNFADISGEDTNLRTLTFDSAKAMVAKFIGERTKVCKPRTIVNEQRKLSRLFAWLIKKGLVSWTANPASTKFQEMPEVTSKPRPPVAPSEVVKLLKAAKVTTIWPSVLLTLTTGLRPIGTLRVKWTDVNFETARLTVTEKGETRIVPLNPWVLSELQAWKDKSASDNVVDLKDRTIHYWMNKIRTEQKLQPEATLQGCRRTFISMAMDRGVSAELVASIAGNSVAVIEKHYKELSTMDTTKVANLMDLSGLLATAPHSKIHSKKKGEVA